MAGAVSKTVLSQICLMIKSCLSCLVFSRISMSVDGWINPFETTLILRLIVVSDCEVKCDTSVIKG